MNNLGVHSDSLKGPIINLLYHINTTIISILWFSTTNEYSYYFRSELYGYFGPQAHVHNNERKTKVTYIGNALSIPGTHKRASVKGFVSSRPQRGPVQRMTINNIL